MSTDDLEDMLAISEPTYRSVTEIETALGKQQEVTKRLTRAMEEASARLAFEQVEVLAFGHLMEEVLQRLTAPSGGQAEAPAHHLQALRQACQASLAGQRPGFEDILDELSGWPV